MDDALIKWLTQKAEAEAQNIKSKQISSLRAIFTSKEEFDANQQAAQRSIGKMELIDELFKYYIATHQPK